MTRNPLDSIDFTRDERYDHSYADHQISLPSGNKLGNRYKRPKGAAGTLPKGMTGPADGLEDEAWCHCHGSWHLR